MYSSLSNPAFHGSNGIDQQHRSAVSPPSPTTTIRDDALSTVSLHVNQNQDCVYVNQESIDHIYTNQDVVNNTRNAGVLLIGGGASYQNVQDVKQEMTNDGDSDSEDDCEEVTTNINTNKHDPNFIDSPCVAYTMPRKLGKTELRISGPDETEIVENEVYETHGQKNISDNHGDSQDETVIVENEL